MNPPVASAEPFSAFNPEDGQSAVALHANMPFELARITAHEAGHVLALQHVQNRGISGRTYPDPLDDTTPGADRRSRYPAVHCSSCPEVRQRAG